MLEVMGDYWQYVDRERPDAICCTINTTLKFENKLVMGAGIAKQFADFFPFLQNDWGLRILGWTNPDKTYILVTKATRFSPNTGGGQQDLCVVGVPTKYDWRHASPLHLVRRSVQQLVIVAEAMGWQKVVMTRPGCGHGKLSWPNQVRPILSTILDDKFVIIHQE